MGIGCADGQVLQKQHTVVKFTIHPNQTGSMQQAASIRQQAESSKKQEASSSSKPKVGKPMHLA